MKRFLFLAFALSCSIPAAAATSPSSQIKPWIGTWTCDAGGTKITQTFTPIFGGNAMRITENGSTPTEHVVVWDAKRQGWIDQAADASGSLQHRAGDGARQFDDVHATLSGIARFVHRYEFW